MTLLRWLGVRGLQSPLSTAMIAPYTPAALDPDMMSIGQKQQEVASHAFAHARR